MTPCEQDIRIEKMRTDIQVMERDIVRLEARQTTTEKAIEKLEMHINEIKIDMQKAQVWLISILIAIVGSFVYERMF